MNRLKRALVCVLVVGYLSEVQAGWFDELTEKHSVLCVSAGGAIWVTGLSILGIRYTFKNKCDAMIKEYIEHLNNTHSGDFHANGTRHCTKQSTQGTLWAVIPCGTYDKYPFGEVKDSTCCMSDVQFVGKLLSSNNGAPQIGFSFSPLNGRLCYRWLTYFNGRCSLSRK